MASLQGVIDLIDLARMWTYADELADEWSCEQQSPACSNEAVYRVRWQADVLMPAEVRCGCSRVTLACVTCYDECASYRLDPSASVQCLKCGLFMEVSSAEPIRRAA